MKSYFQFLILSICLLFSINCFAWNALGHMVIAGIAYDHLTPSARSTVDNIVANFAKEYPAKTTITQIAIWPDQLREDHVDLFSHWHYTDKAFSTDKTPIKNLTDTDNIAWAIPKLETALTNTNLNPAEQARLFAFLIHLTGDVHQPLHTTSRISAEFPKGDAGGNAFSLKPAPIPPDHKAANLHELWDNGCTFFNGEATEKKIASLKNIIETDYPEEYFGKTAQDLSAADWVAESFETAKTYAYATPENQEPSNEYIYQGKKIAEQKAALAGYRLANLINKLFS